MSVIVTARTFYDEFTGTGGGGVSYLNGGVINKMTTKIEFYTYLAANSQRLTFDAATKTITNSNALDGSSFIQNGWKTGMIIGVENTASNNTSFIITRVQDRIITVSTAPTDELAESCDFYDDTPITNLDFLYNIIQNVSQETYVSLTDLGTLQRFSASGLDASDITPVNFKVSVDSWGWVTNEITDTSTGETDEVTIYGAGISGHKQSFVLTQQFSVAPFWNTNQYLNFLNNAPPDYYILPSNMKHIFRCDAKINSGPTVYHTGGITNENGLSNWYNRNNQNTRTDYLIDSISYTIAGDSVDAIDINKTTDIEIIIKSVSGLFVYSAPSAPSTAMVLEFLYNTSNQNDLVNTTTTLRQNILNDRLFFEISDSIQNGEYYGTDYQVLKNIIATFNSANQITLNFQTVFSTAAKARLKAAPDSNRNYSLIITTQDYSDSTTEQNDRISLIADFNLATYDLDDDSLMAAVDGFRVYRYPDIGENAENTVGGYEGDSFYAQFPFTIETLAVDSVTPTLMNAGIQIVAVKTGEDDFVIDEKTFDTGLVRKVSGVQPVNFLESRNFRDLPVEFNQSSIIRDSSFDSGTEKGFMMSHAFILRYEYWLQVIRSSQQFQYPIYNDHTPTEQWSSFYGSGWSLKLKFIGSVMGYDNFTTDFWAYTDIVIKNLGASADSGPVFTTQVDYYNSDGEHVGSDDTTLFPGGGLLIPNEKTKIKVTFTGDFSSFPSGYGSFYAYIFIDLLNNGGITNRRFAGSQSNSEEDSPFTAADADVAASYSFSSNNLTVNVFNSYKVTIETWYDDSVQHWATNNEGIQIYSRLGFIGGDVMLFEDGTEMSFENGSLMLYEYA